MRTCPGLVVLLPKRWYDYDFCMLVCWCVLINLVDLISVTCKCWWLTILRELPLKLTWTLQVLRLLQMLLEEFLSETWCRLASSICTEPDDHRINIIIMASCAAVSSPLQEEAKALLFPTEVAKLVQIQQAMLLTDNYLFYPPLLTVLDNFSSQGYAMPNVAQSGIFVHKDLKVSDVKCVWIRKKWNPSAPPSVQINK